VSSQRIQFFTSSLGARIAMSVMGHGPVIVRTPPWLSHLDLEWQFPKIREFYESLARDYTVVRYDSHGCGLSDWSRDEFSYASEVALLREVAANLGLREFALFGYDLGVPIAISFAARHPGLVSSLILYGIPDLPRRKSFSEEVPEFFQTLMREHWPVAARLIGSFYAREADGAMLEMLMKLNCRGSSGENVLSAIRAFMYEAEFTDLLPELSARTAVIHRMADYISPYRTARELAAGIPGSWLIPLEGNAHLPYTSASEALVEAICHFLGHNHAAAGIEGASREEPASREAQGNEAIFRREGDFWTVGYRKDPFRIKDSQGMRYIAHLLRHPDREFHARELEIRCAIRESASAAVTIGGDEEEMEAAGIHLLGSGDLGEMLDGRAKSAYRRRIQELRADLENAKSLGDVEQASRLEQEISFLARELSRAVGLGGRDRRAGSLAERSRVNVTRAIHRAIDRIFDHDRALGELLRNRIKTGVMCAYRENDRSAIGWEF